MCPPRPAAFVFRCLAVVAAAVALAAGCGEATGGPEPAYDAGLACGELAPAPRGFPAGVAAAVGPEVDNQGRIVAPADTCDRGTLFVEVAAGASTPCADFAETLRETLQARIDERICDYLGTENEEADAPNRDPRAANGFRPAGLDPRALCATRCALGQGADDNTWTRRDEAVVTVRVEPVFQAGGGVELPEGAARRFFRVSIDAEAPGLPRGPLTLPHASICPMLEDLRAAADAGLAACPVGQRAEAAECTDETQPTVRIGRECQILDAGLEATGEMLDWHLTRLGALPAIPAGEAARRPKVALLDTGVEAGLRVPAIMPDGSPDAVPPTHPHGSLLASMMKQVHPGIDLVSIRALGVRAETPGLGTTADVARAVWQALSNPSLAGETPLILNLSMGWPDVLSRPRRVRGTRRTVDPDSGRWRSDDGVMCDTVEDGPGEVVRYALAMAHHGTKLRAEQPVAAFAAAGNRSHVQRDDAAAVASALGHVSCDDAAAPERVRAAWCDGETARPEAPLFLPALWGHLGLPENPWEPGVCGPVARVVEPVAALDVVDLPAAADPAVRQARLAAPGQQVYAGRGGLSAALVTVGSDCDSPALRRKRQPMALTGTSVSSALASALASRVMTGGRFSSAEALYRHLYATGLPVPGLDGVALTRASLDEIPVRRPHLCRALAGLGAACADVMTCVEGADDLATCAATADECLAEAACVTPPVASPAAIPSYPSPVATDPNCVSSAYDGDPLAGWLVTDVLGLLKSGERAERALPVEAAGIVGPQPEIPTCPDCLLSYTQASGTLKLVVDINPKWPVGAKISSPRLVIYDTRFTSGGQASQTLDLTGTAFTFSPVVQPDAWKAKTQVVITGPAPVGSGQLTAQATEWRAFVKAELVANVSGSSQLTAPINISSLRLQAL